MAGELPAGLNLCIIFILLFIFCLFSFLFFYTLLIERIFFLSPQTWQSTILVVSHDRNFLNAVVTDIIHLHSQRLDSYRGDYENFIKTKDDRLKNQQREYEAQLQYRQHIQVQSYLYAN